MRASGLLSGGLMLGGLLTSAAGEVLFEDAGAFIPGFELRRKRLNLDNLLPDDGLRAGGEGDVSGDVETVSII